MRFWPWPKRTPEPEGDAAVDPGPAAEAPGPVPDPAPAAGLSPMAAGRLAAGAPRGQVSAADARATRLAGALRAEMDALRAEVEALRGPASKMTLVDIPAAVEDPEAAALLPPGLLVDALVRLEAENRGLRAKTASQRRRLRRLRRARARTSVRLATLEEVIGVLHENLADLRAARDHALGAGQGDPALPPGPVPRPLHATADADEKAGGALPPAAGHL